MVSRLSLDIISTLSRHTLDKHPIAIWKKTSTNGTISDDFFNLNYFSCQKICICQFFFVILHRKIVNLWNRFEFLLWQQSQSPASAVQKSMTKFRSKVMRRRRWKKLRSRSLRSPSRAIVWRPKVFGRWDVSAVSKRTSRRVRWPIPWVTTA